MHCGEFRRGETSLADVERQMAMRSREHMLGGKCIMLASSPRRRFSAIGGLTLFKKLFLSGGKHL